MKLPALYQPVISPVTCTSTPTHHSVSIPQQASMTLSIASAVVFCILLNCVHIKCQDSFPLPTLSVDPSVNTSNIQLLSQVKLHCTIPDKAPFPVLVYIAHADNPVVNATRWPYFPNLRSPDTIIFTILMKPEAEGTFVCRYQTTRSGKPTDSGLSNSVNMFINSLPNPILSLHPPLILLGSTYIAKCLTPADGYMNVTVSLLERPHPLSPGKETFKLAGIRTLAPEEIGASVNKSAVIALEHICKMEVFYKGRILQSTSVPMIAIPDELPARLYSPGRESATCLGHLSMRVQKDWRTMCFSRKYTIELNVADIVCRESNCGHALSWNKLADSSSNYVGTPQCTGKEKRVAECPIDDLKTCERQSLYVICSGAIPRPKLSAVGHGSASFVYIRSEESVTLTCRLESSSLTQSDSIYFKLSYNGKEIGYNYLRSDSSYEYTITSNVMEGEYACSASPSRSRQSEKSNSIHIYIYDPPPAGAIAAAVITAVAGLAILIFVCVFRTSQENLESNEQAHVAGVLNPEFTQPGNSTVPSQGASENTVNNLPQV